MRALVERTQSVSFACHTPADARSVWSALTDAERTPTYLYGLALKSMWQPDAEISARANGGRLAGRVLCIRPNERLSYLLQAGPSDPPVYLTWLIRANDSGCTIRLQVDEIECADDLETAEDTWLPVLGALQALLAGR